MRDWPIGAWVGVAVATIAVAAVIWLRLRPSSESAVQVIRPPHRSARVEDRLKQLRSEWIMRNEHPEVAGQIANRPAPAGQMPAAPTAPAEPGRDVGQNPATAPTEGAESEMSDDSPLDDALNADEPDLNALKRVLLSDPDPQNRLTAVLLIGTLEDDAAVSVLGQALKDSDEDVRLTAVQALGDFTSAESAQVVQTAMRDPSAEVRFEALSVLADIGGDGARTAMQQATSDEDEDVRALAQGLLSVDEAAPPTKE